MSLVNNLQPRMTKQMFAKLAMQTFFEAQLCHVVAAVVPEQHHPSGFEQASQSADRGLHPDVGQGCMVGVGGAQDLISDSEKEMERGK